MAQICSQAGACNRTRPRHPNRATPGQRPDHGSDPMAQDKCSSIISHYAALTATRSPPDAARLRWSGAGEPACRPGSVHPLSRAGGHPSRTAVAGSLVRSTREHRAGRPRTLAQILQLSRGSLPGIGCLTLLTLLRVGFTEPPQSPAALVVSYTTVSPLPRAGRGAVCFLWHCPAGHPGSVLPTTLPCGARTFLDAAPLGATPRPPGRLARYQKGYSVRRAPRCRSSLSSACRCGRRLRRRPSPTSAPQDC